MIIRVKGIYLLIYRSRTLARNNTLSSIGFGLKQLASLLTIYAKMIRSNTRISASLTNFSKSMYSGTLRCLHAFLDKYVEYCQGCYSPVECVKHARDARMFLIKHSQSIAEIIPDYRDIGPQWNPADKTDMMRIAFLFPKWDDQIVPNTTDDKSNAFPYAWCRRLANCLALYNREDTRLYLPSNVHPNMGCQYRYVLTTSYDPPLPIEVDCLDSRPIVWIDPEPPYSFFLVGEEEDEEQREFERILSQFFDDA